MPKGLWPHSRSRRSGGARGSAPPRRRAGCRSRSRGTGPAAPARPAAAATRGALRVFAPRTQGLLQCVGARPALRGRVPPHDQPGALARILRRGSRWLAGLASDELTGVAERLVDDLALASRGSIPHGAAVDGRRGRPRGASRCAGPSSARRGRAGTTWPPARTSTVPCRTTRGASRTCTRAAGGCARSWRTGRCDRRVPSEAYVRGGGGVGVPRAARRRGTPCVCCSVVGAAARRARAVQARARGEDRLDRRRGPVAVLRVRRCLKPLREWRSPTSPRPSARTATRSSDLRRPERSRAPRGRPGDDQGVPADEPRLLSVLNPRRRGHRARCQRRRRRMGAAQPDSARAARMRHGERAAQAWLALRCPRTSRPPTGCSPTAGRNGWPLGSTTWWSWTGMARRRHVAARTAGLSARD